MASKPKTIERILVKRLGKKAARKLIPEIEQQVKDVTGKELPDYDVLEGMIFGKIAAAFSEAVLPEVHGIVRGAGAHVNRQTPTKRSK